MAARNRVSGASVGDGALGQSPVLVGWSLNS